MIFIPFYNWNNNVGGPFTFMRHLRESLIKRSYSFIEDLKKYNNADSIFFPISFDKEIVQFFKSRGLPIIQRLDGIYYPSKHGLKYIYFNREIKNIYLKYSDFIIFQSEYSKLECFTMLGKIEKEKYRIILNGTDKKIFTISERKFNAGHIRFITTGTYRNKDMLEPVVLALDEVKKDFNIELLIVGPISGAGIENLIDRDYIRCCGRVDSIKLATLLQSSDILIHCQLNPACPNTVIEAISCGIPVVGFDTGAMKEVSFFAPELLAFVSGEIFQRYRDFNPDRLREKIIFCIENYDEYKKRFLDHSYLYDFEKTCDSYIEVFKTFQ